MGHRRPRGRHHKLTIFDVEDTNLTARIRHATATGASWRTRSGPFVEALFDQLAALLERPVFACCDGPSPTRPDLPSLRG